MGENRDRMLRGELYRDSDPDLVASRISCGKLLDRFNAIEADRAEDGRDLLGELLGSIGADSWIMPRFQCDYGTYISIGSNSFLNYDAILLDCAPITIGDDAQLSQMPPHARGSQLCYTCQMAFADHANCHYFPERLCL